jgi:hypothetical protein
MGTRGGLVVVVIVGLVVVKVWWIIDYGFGCEV